MANVTTAVKISVPSKAKRMGWKSLTDTGWSQEVLFEIVMRWCDAQDHAKNYRVRRAERVKVALAKMEELGIDLDSAEEE